MLNQQGWVIQDNHLITQTAVQDLQGKLVGTQLIAQPMDDLTAELEEVLASNIQQISILLIVVILMAISILLSVRKVVIRPVAQLQLMMECVKEKGDFSVRLPLGKSQDEITSMASAFNSLLENIQATLEETQQTLRAIRDGNFKQRIQVHAVGDLDKLKTVVNQSAETIDQTMTSIGDALSALGQANFNVSVEENPHAKGEFKRGLDNAQQTLNRVGEAVAAINHTVSAMANSDFSQGIDQEMTGDLEVLRQNINSANQNLAAGFSSFVGSLSNLIQGDLTAKVTGEYQGELARLQGVINESLSNIARIFIDIKSGAEVALDGIKRVESGGTDLNSRTQSQAASLEETAASMEQITATVRNSLSNSKDANSLAQTARQSANEGAKVMAEAKQAMEGIHAASEKIADITTLIDSIAFQTNLLALNAAVEAARAGEHGRGFAVVAGEVRTLAGRTTDAAKEISSLVADTTEQIDHGSDLAAKSSEMLEQINERINAVSDMVNEITQGAEEQSAGISQVNGAVTSLDSNTQQNAILVETLSQDAVQMDEQMTRLVELINSFKMDSNLIGKK